MPLPQCHMIPFLLRFTSGQLDLTNPTYSSTSPQLSVPYSSFGPHNHASGVENKGHTPILPEGGDRTYHMLAAPGQRGGGVAYEEGGGIYHMLGEEGNEVEEKTYEVPMSGISQEPTVLDTEYSTLQHH